MATNRSGHRPGGGIASRVNVSPQVRTGTGSRGTHPGGVGQLGQMQGSHVTRGEDSNYRGDPFYRGKGYATPVGPTDNVAACGVGGGRKVYASGSQGLTGNVAPGNPPAQRGDILSQYGPDYRRPRNNP